MDKRKHSFGGLTGDFSAYETAEIVILPVPFDKTSTWIKGAARGPEAIIKASEHMELYDIETDSETYLRGIHTTEPILSKTSADLINKTHKRVRALLNDGKFIVVLGGEHSISIGSVKAHNEFYDDVSVLQLDAHTDMRDSYLGDPYNHACSMARIHEFIENIVSVGIRSMDSTESEKINTKKIFYAQDIRDSRDWIREAVNKLSENVYVTIDLDVFDPSIMPSTGTPEPGGLDWYTINNLLKKVSEKKNIIGFDVMELCPSENYAPDFLAAKLIYKTLSYRFSSKD